jgi:isopentenyldiphosphate isomerase/O-antigen ligase
MSESAENASVAAQENAEMLDVVDDSNRVIDCLARGQVHDDGLKHRSVHLAIFNPAGELFIHKRSAEKSRLAGYWDISAAGHVEPGESYPDAARRELGEELGVEVPLSAATVFEASEATGNEFAALFIGMCGQEVQPSPREIELGEWVSLHKLAERLANPGDEKYTSNLVNIAMFLAQNQHLLPEDVQKESGLGSREEIQFKKFFGQAEENHTSEPTDDVSTESGNTDNEATDSVVADNTASSAKQIISLLKVQQIVAWPGLPTHPVSHRRLLKGAFDGPMPRLEAALSKYLFLGILASLALAILAYPWGFEQATLDGILDKYGLNSEYQGTLVGWFALTQIYPLVASGVEPLILKETMVAWVILAAVPLFALLILLRPGRRLLRLPFFLLFAAFLSYGAYSVLYILPSESLKMGLYTWTRILTWTLLIAITASVVRTRRQVTCILIFLGLVLTLMTFGSITQHLQWDTVLPRYVGSVRNRMSSTIGHNNGVASLLIYAWFPSLAMIFLARKIQLRAAAIVLTGIILFVLLALQTRGVWIVLLALTPPFLFICQRTSPLPIKARHVLLVVGFLLLAVLVQSIDSPLNPFKGPISLVERFQDFSPTKLKTTTQRRILKASLAYMPDETERWMFGVGLGGFIYVYPEIQAQYFAKLQGETDVLYRPKRTVQAHSDLLQLYIETGMVGILLLLIALWLLARRMEGTFRATPDIPGKLQQLAIYFPMLGTMLHGVGDFPFHIASTTTTAAIFLGITLAGRRIWAPASATLPEPTRIQRSLSGAAEGKLAGIRFGILLFCLVLYLPAMTMMVVNGAYMASRSLAHMSSVLLDRYRSDPDLQGTMLGRGALLQVRHDLRGAFRLKQSCTR